MSNVKYYTAKGKSISNSVLYREIDGKLQIYGYYAGWEPTYKDISELNPVTLGVYLKNCNSGSVYDIYILQHFKCEFYDDLLNNENGENSNDN